MNPFENMSTDDLEESTDSLGTSFAAVPTDVYEAEIKFAYLGKSQSSKAQSLTVHATLGGAEFRETIWVTNGKGENFYLSKDGKNTKHPLPGYTTADDLCLMAAQQPLNKQNIEKKTFNLYDFELRKEVPKEVDTLVDLIGKKVSLGITREVVDKEKKDDSGQYKPTGETRIQNTINKVFHPETGRTVNEYRHDIPTPEFRDSWIERFKGKDKIKAKGVPGANGPGSAGTGRPGAAGSPAAATRNIFGT